MIIPFILLRIINKHNWGDTDVPVLNTKKVSVQTNQLVLDSYNDAFRVQIFVPNIPPVLIAK